MHRLDEPFELLPSALVELDPAVRRGLTDRSFGEVVDEPAVARAL
jgi:hypothetical protein